MRRYLIALLFGLGACSQPVSQSTTSLDSLSVPDNACEAAAQPICAFFNAPLTLLTTPIRLLLRKETFYPMANDLQFVDSENKTWVAPKGTLTDGASIPSVFVAMIGNPTSKEFVNAAAIHDAYCGIGNDDLAQYHSDTWQNVHRMFYDALRVGGTAPKKAKIMFAAVYIGGPRWSPPRNVTVTTQVTKNRHLPNLQISTKSGAEPQRSPNGQTLRQMGVSNQRLRGELEAAIDFINTTNPSIAELERFLIKRDDRWRGLANQDQGLGGEPDSFDPSDPSYP